MQLAENFDGMGIPVLDLNVRLELNYKNLDHKKYKEKFKRLKCLFFNNL